MLVRDDVTSISHVIIMLYIDAEKGWYFLFLGFRYLSGACPTRRIPSAMPQPRTPLRRVYIMI